VTVGVAVLQLFAADFAVTTCGYAKLGPASGRSNSVACRYWKSNAHQCEVFTRYSLRAQKLERELKEHATKYFPWGEELIASSREPIWMTHPQPAGLKRS
jgi:hypothetical protein